MLSHDEMGSLPAYFASIPDPRRRQGQRHPLRVVLAIAAGATLCGMQGYKAIAQWAQALGQPARARFGCRIERKVRVVPSESVIRDCLVRVDPSTLTHAIQQWQGDQGQQDEALAMDGKTMKGAIDKQGHQAHIMSVIGHDTKTCIAQKK